MFGGPERIRTADLFIANEALYQLSYGPLDVGAEGVEPSTSSLSVKRSTAELRAQNLNILNISDSEQKNKMRKPLDTDKKTRVLFALFPCRLVTRSCSEGLPLRFSKTNTFIS